MISALKATFSLNNLKILRLRVTKNLTKLLKKFCEFRSRSQSYQSYFGVTLRLRFGHFIEGSLFPTLLHKLKKIRK